MRSITLRGVGVALALLLPLSACQAQGDQPDDKATSGDSAQYSTAVEAARASVEQFSADQPPIDVPPLDGPAPTGLKVAVITCVVPVCQSGTDPAIEAAQRLGWEVYEGQYELTPEDYASVWTAALQQKPDAIIYVPAFPGDVIKDQLAEANEKKLHLVAVTYNTPTREDSGTSHAVSGAPVKAESGRLMGDVVVADAGGPSEVVFVWDPLLKNTLGPLQDAFSERVGEVDIEPQTLDVELAKAGQSVPGEVVNFLQRNPDVEYVVLALADLGAGIPQALAAVGLEDKVKIVSRSPQAADLEAIKNGEHFASIAEESAASGYRAMDAVVRLAMGGQPVDNDPPGWHQIMVQENVSDTTGPPETPGVPEVFYKAWGLE